MGNACDGGHGISAADRAAAASASRWKPRAAPAPGGVVFDGDERPDCPLGCRLLCCGDPAVVASAATIPLGPAQPPPEHQPPPQPPAAALAAGWEPLSPAASSASPSGSSSSSGGSRSSRSPSPRGGEPVYLHLYDLSEAFAQVNSVAVDLLGFGGALHVGAEVLGSEWSFGMQGVSVCSPKNNQYYTYRQSVRMGRTRLPRQEIIAAILEMQGQWSGKHYDVFVRNCGTFCSELCERLGVGAAPAWITRLPDTLGRLPAARALAESIARHSGAGAESPVAFGLAGTAPGREAVAAAGPAMYPDIRRIPGGFDEDDLFHLHALPDDASPEELSPRRVAAASGAAFAAAVPCASPAPAAAVVAIDASAGRGRGPAASAAAPVALGLRGAPPQRAAAPRRGRSASPVRCRFASSPAAPSGHGMPLRLLPRRSEAFHEQDEVPKGVRPVPAPLGGVSGAAAGGQRVARLFQDGDEAGADDECDADDAEVERMLRRGGLLPVDAAAAAAGERRPATGAVGGGAGGGVASGGVVGGGGVAGLGKDAAPPGASSGAFPGGGAAAAAPWELARGLGGG